MTLRLCGISKESFVDGPGIRFVVFTQGCPHHCPGCHNPQTHGFSGGETWQVDDLFELMGKNPLQEGITFSGGEPFSQAQALSLLAQKIKGAGMNLWIYTGYTYEELLQMSQEDEGVKALLDKTDVLVDGRFILKQRTLGTPFIGSQNQRLIDVPKSLKAGGVILWEAPVW